MTGTEIRALRRLACLRQSDLADKTGLSLRQIGRIERGQSKPSRATLKLIMMALE